MSNKEILIEQLIEKDIFKMPDGRELYEGMDEELLKFLEETMSRCIKKGNSCERVPMVEQTS